jgi:protocatechuate 3,4-dioxygenase beta subunit
MKARRLLLCLLCAVLGCHPAALQRALRAPNPPAAVSLPECEWCGAAEAPKKLHWRTRVAPEAEPGEPLVISGTVYRSDGETPAPDVILYLYQTNDAGFYPKRGDETGNGRRHGYLRSWLESDRNGRYEFATIKPGPYPGGSEPAHIHATVTEPGQPEAEIDSFVFEGDPFLTPGHLAMYRGRGGSGIVRLALDGEGVWRGTRDVVLEP